MGCHALLQIAPTQGSNLSLRWLLHWQAGPSLLVSPRKPPCWLSILTTAVCVHVHPKLPNYPFSPPFPTANRVPSLSLWVCLCFVNVCSMQNLSLFTSFKTTPWVCSSPYFIYFLFTLDFFSFPSVEGHVANILDFSLFREKGDLPQIKTWKWSSSCRCFCSIQITILELFPKKPL